MSLELINQYHTHVFMYMILINHPLVSFSINIAHLVGFAIVLGLYSPRLVT